MIQNISFEHSPCPSVQPTLLSSLRQNINNLTEPNPVLRKQSIKTLHNIITTSQMSSNSIQQISRQFLKNILLAFSDHSEEVREYSIKIVIELMIRSEEVNQMLPYIMAVLVQRLNCKDLEGIQNLPEAMRPPPGQKPHVVIKLVQTSEEVRLAICKLLQKIIGLVDVNVIRRYLDDMVNCIRSLVMDPCGDIQLNACNILGVFCQSYKNILLNYTQTMGRAILLPLISKKSKIRVSALNTLNKILLCGVWKYNAFIFENLIGFRDPNSVAIKDFYSPSLNINYLGSLISDTNIKVRQTFFNSMYFWICVLDDKYDHHPKLIPYVLSGLFDQQQKIQQISFKILEEIGEQIQKQKYAEFKDNFQYGIDSQWTWEGKLKSISLPYPFVSRPRLGSRFFVKGHVSKMWPALFRESKDLNFDHRKKAVNLALMGVIYTEQYMTSHLNKFIPNFITLLKINSPQDIQISKKVQQIFQYLGIFCPFSSYIHIIKSGILGQFISNEQFIQSTFKALSKLMKGNLSAIPQDVGLGHKKKDINELLNFINEIQLYNQINDKNSLQVEQLVVIILNGIKTKGTNQQQKALLSAHFIDFIKLFMISVYEQNLRQLSRNNVKQIKQLNFSLQTSQFLIKMNQMIKLNQFNQVPSLQQQIQQIFANPPSLNQTNFKFIIALFINFIRYQPQHELLQTTIQVILELISINRLSQLINFFFKMIKSLLISQQFLNESNKNKVLPHLIKIVSSCAVNLSKFKSYKKVPVYQESKEYDPEDLIINQDYLIQIFQHLTWIIQAFQEKNILKNQHQLLSQVIYSYIKVINNFKRIKTIRQNSIRPIWALLERIQKLQPEKLKYQNEYLYPVLIDYLVQRIETLQSGSNVYYLVIIALLKLFKYFPNFQSNIIDLPIHYPDYPSLITKLLKYYLNEKDIEAKLKLKQILVVLAEKMKLWFQLQLKEAISKGMYQRVKLLQQILQ